MGGRLLLVDDDVNVLRALQRVLRRDGYDLFTATSAQGGFEVLNQHSIDVVLSDQRMPGQTGTEFLKRVKDQYPRTVRLMLSGYTELHSVTEAINQGAIYKFLTKPWDDEQLRANIREAFQRRAIETQNILLKEEVESVNAELVTLNHILEQRVQDGHERIERDNHHTHVLQEVLDHLPLAVIGIDSAGDVAAMNATACNWLGLRQGALIGESHLALPAPIAEELTEGLKSFDFEERRGQLRLNTQLYWFEIRSMGRQSGSSGCVMWLTRSIEETR